MKIEMKIKKIGIRIINHSQIRFFLQSNIQLYIDLILNLFIN